MRILNVTETYAPFLEFGGPPVKVRALCEGLGRRGHQATVLTADWGLEKKMQTQEGKIAAERSPFGWRREENGVQAIYLPTWMRYRADRDVRSDCPEPLAETDVSSDLWAAVAARSKRRDRHFGAGDRRTFDGRGSPREDRIAPERCGSA